MARLLENSRQQPDPPDPLAIHPHFSACDSCREQFQELLLFDRQLKTMKPDESEIPERDCPQTDIWRNIAGGLTSSDDTLEAVEHASRCEHCGPLLRKAVGELATLNGEITEAERKHIATLESAGTPWQQHLARRITGTPESGPTGKSAPWWRDWFPQRTVSLAAVGASVLAVVVAGSWFSLHFYENRQQPATAQKLLASAYTQKRTLELRIAGAAYAPLRISRGPAASFTNRPAALLKAESLIASQLQNHPSNASWLQAEAQADLLEGKYDAAVEALRRALELEPQSPAVLIDLATAYFQRAQQEDRKDDLGAAYENLSQALKARPDDPVALFNRALVAEHQFLFHQALDDWDHYLQVDSHSDWASEAREASDRVRSRLKEHETGQAEPLLSPAQIVAAAENPNLKSTVDARIEEYLSGAVRSWLPQAYPRHGTADPAARRALFFLAQLTKEQHHDGWLSNLLRGSSQPDFPQAVADLADAARTSEDGNYATTDAGAAHSSQLFRNAGNQAGALRADFEGIQAAQMERRTDTCLHQASTALAESEKHSYPWLQIQLTLEKSVCSFLLGDIGLDEKLTQRAVDLSEKNSYPAVYLRGIFFAADDALATGDRLQASSLTDSGLQRFWSAQFPMQRGYSFYLEKADIARASGRPNLALAAQLEGVSLTASSKDVLSQAWQHHYVARAAVAVGQPELAQKHFAEAARLFSMAPRGSVSRQFEMDSKIEVARLDGRFGRLDDAIARLASIQDEVRQLSNNFVAENFYSTLGELQLERHREPEAEQALRPALSMAETNLRSLHSEAERTSWAKNAAPAYLAYVEAELLQGRQLEALAAYDWYLVAPQRAAEGRVTGGVDPSLISETSQLVSRRNLLLKQTVVAYAALPDGIAIWVCDNRGINTRWIPGPKENLQQLAERFRALASDPSASLAALRRDSRTLYDALIAPIDPWLDDQRTLVIESDGWLSRVPFEALLDSQNHYLIERAPIVHSLGERSNDAAHEDKANKTGLISRDSPALVVGSTAASQDEGLIPLPDASREADVIARNFTAPRVLSGEDATLAALRENLPAASIFHFAGHSFELQGRAGLLLQSDPATPHNISLLDADTLREFDLRRIRLAVLSACSTEYAGEDAAGFDSITDVLLRAGVPHVIASRWAVDSVETRAFVEDFYKNALAGQPPSAALRQTALNTLANPRTAHPFYWSAFLAFGRP